MQGSFTELIKKFSKIIYLTLMQLSPIDVVLQTCYWAYLSDYQVILVSQRQTTKQKGPGVR